MIVILAEKPDVATKIAGALGGIHLPDGKVVAFEQLNARAAQVNKLKANGFFETEFQGERTLVTWAYGHLCGLKQAADYHPEYKDWNKIPKPFIPAKYELKLDDEGSMGARVREQIKVIKKLFSEADLIINATDYDREGEVIFAYIYEYLKCRKPVKRACFSSMTKDGFAEAFANLKEAAEVKPTEEAGRMRAIADWVVGANLTVAMTKRKGAKRGEVLSVGRVQTPTLNIVVAREKEIKAFQVETYYTVEGLFTTDRGETYRGTHEKKRFSILSEAEAEMARLQADPHGTVTHVEKKPKSRPVPHLYSLASLQMDANAKFGMTLKRTLDTAQSLYSKGYTTYPRTSSQYLTEDMGPTVNRVLSALARQNGEYAAFIGDRKVFYHNKYYFDNSKVESHYAIIPTGVEPHGLTADEAKLYDLIARSVIEMLYKAAQLEETKVTTTVAGAQFASTGTVIKDPGWMAVGGTFGENPLPDLSEGERVEAAFEQKEKQTEPPRRYSDKTLLNAMINCGKEVEDEELRKVLEDPNVNGIGTSATRDSIIETLIKRDYMERRGKVFYATDKGIRFIDSLPLDDLKGAELTARWEQRMSAIEHGTDTAAAFRKDIETQTTAWTEKILETPVEHAEPVPTIIPCPKCGQLMMKYEWGIACPDWKKVKGQVNCGFTVGTKGGVIIPEEQVEKLVREKKTDLIRGFKGRTGWKFNAWLILNDDLSVGFEFEKKGGAAAQDGEAPAEVEILDKPGEDMTETVLKLPCPKCGKGLKVTPTGYACAEDCGWTFGTACHKRLSDEEVINYLTKGETGMLEGFISKTGKPFKANLKMRANKTMQYVFERRSGGTGNRGGAKNYGGKTAKSPTRVPAGAKKRNAVAEQAKKATTAKKAAKAAKE